MPGWKQIVLALVVLVAAAAAWARFYPGAPQVWRAGAIAPWAMVRRLQRSKRRPGGGRQAGRNGTQIATIVASPVASAVINDRLQAIGTGRADASVTVNPYSSGRLAELLVESGTHVDKGQIIATLDSETEIISQDRAKLALQDAQSKLDRVKSLRASNAATPVAVADAEVVLAGAKLALQDAELALQRRSILAPIAGTVGILPISAGNYVTNQSAIATLDDRSSILVDFQVPERFAAAIKVGAQFDGDADRQSEQRLYRHGIGHRQSHRREEPHAPGQGRDRQSGRFAARRHVVLHHHEISLVKTIRPGKPAGDPVGCMAPTSGRSRTARRNACRCASSSATPKPC